MDITAGKRRISLFFLHKELFYAPRLSLSNSICTVKEQFSYGFLPLHQFIKE